MTGGDSNEDVGKEPWSIPECMVVSVVDRGMKKTRRYWLWHMIITNYR